MSIQNPSKEEIKEILQKANTIAVVGLSSDPNKTSYHVAKAMQDAGYKIIPVNPTVDEVLGEKAVPSLEDIEGHVDIVNIFRRPEYLPLLARQFTDMDADVFWAQLGIESEEAYQYLKDHDRKVVMNHCIMVEHSRLL